MPSKDKDLAKHRRSRFHERFGINLTKTIEDRIASDIKHRRSRKFYTQSLRVSAHYVWVPELNDVVAVIWDRSRHCGITFLTVEMTMVPFSQTWPQTDGKQASVESWL